VTQETGETRNAIIEADEKVIQDILDTNKSKRDLYWIVMFSKPSRSSVDGKPTLIKHIKPYSVKPAPQVGMISGEVDNSKGTINWDINMPQRPFDFDALKVIGAEDANEVVVETTSIPNAYVTQ
tara:strand:- start:1501 stop:1872 length:372 start_codon:yes stop_codon:yes gene_type:complete